MQLIDEDEKIRCQLLPIIIFYVQKTVKFDFKSKFNSELRLTYLL